MKRKTYIIIILSITFISCVFVHIYDNTRYENLVISIINGTLAVFFLYTAYLLIVKKSYNLLAGMTEKLAEEIKNNLEEEKKFIKKSKIVGYIFIIFALLFLISAWVLIRQVIFIRVTIRLSKVINQLIHCLGFIIRLYIKYVDFEKK